MNAHRRHRWAAVAVRVTALAAVALTLVMGTLTSAAHTRAPAARPWMNTALSPDQRATLLLAQMTLAEKVQMLYGQGPSSYAAHAYSYHVPAIPRLGIPELNMGDDSAGVRLQVPAGPTGFKTTALPFPIALGASWDPSAAQMEGDVAGTEIRASGQDVLLGPTADIIRQPWGGRVSETESEDPLLTADIVVPYIRAVQAHDVVSTLKHYNVYNQETNRLLGLDALVDERALQEIYTPPFDAAVSQAHVGAVMCGFTSVNGAPACDNAHLLDDILKTQLGFKGWVMTDFGAPHSARAILAGLDQEQPTEVYFGQTLINALKAGQVSLATIDDSVQRILRSMFALGLFDHPPTVGAIPIQQDDAKARQIADETITLLKNAGGALPLSPSAVRSIAAIGGDANDLATAGGSSLVNNRTHIVTPLQGLQARGQPAGIQVRYAPGTDPVEPTSMLPGPAAVPSSVLTPAGAAPGAHGVLAQYWTTGTSSGTLAYTQTDAVFSGTPAYTRTQPQVTLDLGFLGQTFNASAVPPVPTTYGAPTAARWTGTLTAPTTGDYSFALTGWGQDRLRLDGHLIIDAFAPHGERVDTSPTLHLVGGQPHTIEVDYATAKPLVPDQEFGSLQLGWTHPADAYSPAMQDAATLARRSDVAVVFARDYTSEERDRASLTLPNDQDQLIRAVEAANPRTIVVLTTSGPVTMPWLDQTPAVLEAWYGGQEQGAAIAGVLFGDVDPSGHLPVTFPRNDAQVPVANPLQQGILSSAATTTVPYTESVFVGYRSYDRFGLDPLFPFGYGLSYTSFGYRNLSVTASPTGESWTVSFTVQNTGNRRGAAVAQVYVGRLPTNVSTPPKQLAGFVRVTLVPGEQRRVSVEVSRRSVSYWDTNTKSWLAPPGLVPVYVGESSRDVKLYGTIAVGAAAAGSP